MLEIFLLSNDNKYWEFSLTKKINSKFSFVVLEDTKSSSKQKLGLYDEFDMFSCSTGYGNFEIIIDYLLNLKNATN
jgi:hypothetical protein